MMRGITTLTVIDAERRESMKMRCVVPVMLIIQIQNKYE